MPYRAHAPEQLLSAPFPGRTATSRGLLTVRQLDSPIWVRMLRGVYRHRDLEPTDEVRAAALRLVLRPGAVVAGRTAAWLQGAWKPRPGVPIPLEYARPVAAAGIGIAGTRYRRLELRSSFGVDAWGAIDGCWGDVTEVHGVAVLSVLRTCFDLMRDRALVEAIPPHRRDQHSPAAIRRSRRPTPTPADSARSDDAVRLASSKRTRRSRLSSTTATSPVVT
jgi:hypothetical protein